MSTGQTIAFPNSGGTRHPAPEDLPLFAMELLPDAEAAAIAEHVARCPECHAELARVFGDLALAAITVDLEAPPEAARQRLMQQVAREKKIVSAPATQDVRTDAADTLPPIAAFGRTGALHSIEDRPRRHAGRTVFAIAGWAAAAVLAVAVGLEYQHHGDLAGTVIAQDAQLHRLNADAASSHKLLEALTDPQAVRVTLTAKPLPKAQPIGGVTYNPHKGSLVFLASNLDPLETYKTYELWVIPSSGGAPIPAGTFHPDDQGNASVIMPSLPPGIAAKAFGVTIEPDGGSQTPTLPIILSGS